MWRRSHWNFYFRWIEGSYTRSCWCISWLFGKTWLVWEESWSWVWPLWFNIHFLTYFGIVLTLVIYAIQTFIFITTNSKLQVCISCILLCKLGLVVVVNWIAHICTTTRCSTAHFSRAPSSIFPGPSRLFDLWKFCLRYRVNALTVELSILCWQSCQLVRLALLLFLLLLVLLHLLHHLYAVIEFSLIWLMRHTFILFIFKLLDIFEMLLYFIIRLAYILLNPWQARKEIFALLFSDLLPEGSNL